MKSFTNVHAKNSHLSSDLIMSFKSYWWLFETTMDVHRPFKALFDNHQTIISRSAVCKVFIWLQEEPVRVAHELNNNNDNDDDG